MRSLLVTLTLAGLMAFRSPGLAQTKDTTETLKNYEIEEVIVTGTRTERKIIDIPYPTLLIDNAEYRFERKTAVNDVMEAVPGLFMQSRYGNHDVRISIRGFGSRSNTGIRGVRILLDGIPESEPDGQTRIEAIDFQSVGKIEIVKGNASSLYTNAPGGVINFINDIYFPGTFATAFGETGSNGYRSYGLKTGVKTDQYRFLMTYNRHVADGYRPHSDDEWHIVNSVVETKPSDLTRLSVFTNYANGEIRLPGSLTRAQYDEDPFQANARDVARDAFRLTKKGRLGLKFEVFSGEGPTPNQLEVTGYLTSKYFHRTARTYRIFDRQGIGGSARYVYHLPLFGRHNELSVGGDAYFQSGPISEFDNINGEKGDILEGLTDETISNAGLYFQNSFNLIKDKSDLLITGRYDGVVFESRNQVLEVQNAKRKFDAFTPKAALNYKLTPTIAAYTSYGLGFDTPAGNELDNYPTSSNPYPLLNPDLKPQKSRNFELGIKGNVVEPDRRYFRDLFFEATLFHIKIEDEIVPFEVFGDVFYRNSARTNRTGMEIGANAEVLKGLRWKTAYTFSDFTYGSYVARTIELDSVGNIVAIDRSFNGNAVPSVPKHNLSLAVSYEHEIVRHVTGFAKLSYLAISGMQVDDGNTEKSAGYQLLNSTIGIDMTFDRFNVLATAGINNLTDREYVAFININSATGEFYEAGEPRAFFAGVNLGYRF